MQEMFFVMSLRPSDHKVLHNIIFIKFFFFNWNIKFLFY